MQRTQTGRQPLVMHVLPSLHSCGGAEQLVYRMARAMAASGSAPIICCTDSIGDLGVQLKQEGYRVYSRKKTGSLDLALVMWMSRIIKAENVQVLHAHMYEAFEHSVPAALFSPRAGVVYTVHGRLYPEERSVRRRIMYPLWSLGVDQLVSISEQTKKAMACYDFHPEPKIKVVHNGIVPGPDPDRTGTRATRVSLGLDETTRILGTAARLEDIKNLPMMLRAFSQVLKTHPDTRLLIAGEGSRAQSLVHHAEELGIAEKVSFLGQRSDLQRIYPLFEVFLLSSFTEGISVSLLEAMSHGVPGIATAVGGNPEVLLDGETGYLVPSDDDAAMAEKITLLLDHRDQAARFGRNARDRVLRHFSFDGMMREYMDIYNNLAEKKQRHGKDAVTGPDCN